jgi:hypothetical protein
MPPKIPQTELDTEIPGLALEHVVAESSCLFFGPWLWVFVALALALFLNLLYAGTAIVLRARRNFFRKTAYEVI